ncbi:LANO_0B01288g1_1 [Lachancea nothofagi CBS 11611]|uniref:allantoicase n=1 Tax=Lachancea nothofagi CBS 11611 TaxID=1266666 RepID=A0A1G4IVC7_9SACH|nr:LANO_0B01288g1_1 [Lachancea nothofagi CBS 11611]
MFYYTQDQADEFLSKVTADHMAVDVVGRKLGGFVMSCSDEWFAEARNLLEPKAPIRDATKFVHAGAWYDGWETRRHNANEYDWTIMKMGVAAAHIVGCEVDTAFFNGNHAPAISVEALYAENEKHIAENDPRWEEVIPKKECGPSQRQFMLRKAATDKRYTHIKLKMYPDGGIARFRLYGRVVPPTDALMKSLGVIDLASACNGGVALRVSDQHFGSADNLLLPGRGHDMSDGWETKRSRTPGHVDWAIIQLGKRTSKITTVIVDTAHFRGNFPQYVTVHGIDCSSSTPPAHDDPKWFSLVGKSKTGPDLEHEFEVTDSHKTATHIKLTIIPDGGVKRIRVFGN